MLNQEESKFRKGLNRLSDEDGATTVEYIMILGIMAIVVAILFLTNTFGLKSRIQGLGCSIGNMLGKTSTDLNNSAAGGTGGTTGASGGQSNCN